MQLCFTDVLNGLLELNMFQTLFKTINNISN